jgi:hypothetical protein
MQAGYSRVLNSDFPCRDRAQKDFVSGIAEQLSRSPGKLSGTRSDPQERAGIQEQSHVLPSNASTSSSGKGLKNDFGILSLFLASPMGRLACCFLDGGGFGRGVFRFIIHSFTNRVISSMTVILLVYAAVRRSLPVAARYDDSEDKP